jgi:hypothetical protein
MFTRRSEQTGRTDVVAYKVGGLLAEGVEAAMQKTKGRSRHQRSRSPRASNNQQNIDRAANIPAQPQQGNITTQLLGRYIEDVVSARHTFIVF